MLGIPSSEHTSVLISVGYYYDECQIYYRYRKGIEDVWRKRRQSIGLIDFIVDNDMPTSSKVIMNGLGFKKTRRHSFGVEDF